MKNMTYDQFKCTLTALTDKIRQLTESIAGAPGVEENDVKQVKSNARMHIESLEEALYDDFGEILDD